MAFRRDEPYSSNEVASGWSDSPDRPLAVVPSSASGCPQPSQRWCDARSGRGDRHPAARRRAGDVSEQPHYRAAVPGRHFYQLPMNTA